MQQLQTPFTAVMKSGAAIETPLPPSPKAHEVTASTQPAPRAAAPFEARPDLAALSSAQTRNHLLAALAQYFTYPALARRQGWEGEVLLALTIEPDGELQNLQVARSSGYAVLDDAALRALRRVERLSNAEPWLQGHGLDMRLPVVYRLREH